ncbi:hypothetical protein [Azohydromonas aeria]|uniref:hypothetical protein n=1 Tax=Azohydromonas aeria TaxID=2590212 RepID=UPI0012FC9F89|nr:hypothetical protein [Azohydromonas aeria]
MAAALSTQTLIMDNNSLSRRPAEAPPAEYLSAMADLERRAFRGELSLRQVRHEIFALRERFGAEPALVMQWAVGSR